MQTGSGGTASEAPFPLVHYAVPLSGGGLPVSPANADPFPLPERLVAEARPLIDIKRAAAPASSTVMQTSVAAHSQNVRSAVNGPSLPNSPVRIDVADSADEEPAAGDELSAAKEHSAPDKTHVSISPECLRTWSGYSHSTSSWVLIISPMLPRLAKNSSRMELTSRN